MRITHGRGHLSPLSWICEPCRDADHAHCVGRGHCDCQHRGSRPTEPVTGAPGE